MMAESKRHDVDLYFENWPELEHQEIVEALALPDKVDHVVATWRELMKKYLILQLAVRSP